MKIVALDLGKGNSVACVFDSESARHRFETVASTPAAVHDLLAAEGPDRVVMEVGPLAGWVCDLCRALGLEAQVADPTQEAWRWKNVKRKSDRDDALKLARLSAMNQINPVHVPAPRVRAWRELIAYRHSLIQRRTAIKNSLRATLTRQAIAWPAGPSGWTQARRRQLEAMAAEADGAVWRGMVREDLAQMTTLDLSIAAVEKELDAVAAQDGRVALLQTIPGVGRRLAETLVAVIDEPRRFRNRRQVGCYAGLTPRKIQSGGMDRQGRISGRGHELLRSLLVEVSWLGRRHNPWMHAVYERARKGSVARKKVAVVALARRLLVVCWAMMRDGTPWRDGQALRLAQVA